MTDPDVLAAHIWGLLVEAVLSRGVTAGEGSYRAETVGTGRRLGTGVQVHEFVGLKEGFSRTGSPDNVKRNWRGLLSP